METQGERLVARLRHHTPYITVTELHVERIGHENKNRVIEFLHSLKLAPNVESSAGLETVVSVEVPDQTNQRDLVDRILAFIEDLDVGDVSITSEPFDERQPEIEVTEDSLLLEGTLSQDYTALNSQDIEELISKDRSESEFELILAHPGQGSSQGSRSLPLHQSSKDVIRSLLKVTEARDVSRGSVQRYLSRKNSSRDHTRGVKQQNKLNFWTRAKNVFRRKKRQPVHTVQYFHVQTASVIDLSSNRHKTSFSNFGIEKNSFQRKEIVNGRCLKNKISINTFQSKCFEYLSQDLLPLDAWTQTKHIASGNISEDCCTQTNHPISDDKEETCPKKARCDSSGTLTLTEESGTSISKGHQGPSSPRGMIRNIIPIYPQPTYFKQPVLYSLNPVVTYNNGGQIFFRRTEALKTISPESRSDNATRTMVTGSSSPSSPTNSSTSDVTVIDANQEKQDNLLHKTFPSHESRKVKCGVITTINNSPFELDKQVELYSEDSCWIEQSKKEIQTEDPDVIAADTNTSMVFHLTKITQTDQVRPLLKKKLTIRPNRLSQTFGTQTSALFDSSTSCTELVPKRSCGTVVFTDRVDRDISCHIIPNKATTENKEVGCEVMYSVNVGPDKRKRSHRRQKKTLGWGLQPDGRLGYGQVYAPGKVVPIVNFGPAYSTIGPFQQLLTKQQQAPPKACPRICGFFSGRKRAMQQELKRQHLELLQMKTLLVAINEEILAESSTISSSDEEYPPSYQQVKSPKKVTFRDPLVD